MPENRASHCYARVALITRQTPLDPDWNPEFLGFKAYNLGRMAAIGLNVPPAFVLGTGFCDAAAGLAPEAWRPSLRALEAATGEVFGDPKRPLLLSVRSGAPVSMPGMMETLLNIGLTDATLPGFIRQTGHPRLAWDAYRRLIAGYGEVVAGIEVRVFEADLAAITGGEAERDLDFEALRALARRHLATYERCAGAPFPQDPLVQLQSAIRAVFASWNSEKARAYRDLRHLPHDMGTAVTVQRMVFGNAGGLSGAGVGFTRNPGDGDPHPWVDFLFNAQGEDVVSGRRSAEGHTALAAVAPRVWDELVAAAAILERELRDMQDFEFTVENGRLFLLQTRDGKRTPLAAARIALDMADEGLIDPETARQRTAGIAPEALAVTVLANAGEQSPVPLAHAASAASGVVSGVVALDESRARQFCGAGKAVILVRRDAETRDIAALDLAAGLLTQRGARTSHAAVVARQLGKVCLVGCEAMRIDEQAGRVMFGDRGFSEGDWLTLDGNTGDVHAGEVGIRTIIPEALLVRLAVLRGLQSA